MKLLQTIIFQNILPLFDVLTNFPPTTSEERGTFTFKHSIYNLPDELQNNLTISFIGN